MSKSRLANKIDSYGGKFALLNGDDHANLLRKQARDPSIIRPDITHQCLLTLLDSPLNKAGKLQVYIRTQKGILIEVSPLCRIPRTFPRFAGLMVQLLNKLTVKAENSSEKLLSVIKNPLELHLPTRHYKIAMSTEGKLVKFRDYVVSEDSPVPGASRSWSGLGPWRMGRINSRGSARTTQACASRPTR